MRKSKHILRQVIMIFLLSSSFFLIQCSSDDDVKSSITILSLSPESGSIGTVVSIAGKGFSETASNNIVKFNGTTAEVALASATVLVVSVPDGATTGKVTVQIGNETATGPTFSVTQAPYYIKFKANGVQKIFEESNPGFQACGNCACSSIPVLSSTKSADLSICNGESDWVTGADIVSWNGDKVIFTTGLPIAHFGYYENETTFDTDYADSQTDSEVNITEVTSDPNDFGVAAYKVKGNFKCRVATSEGADIVVTEGEFVVRYTEDF